MFVGLFVIYGFVVVFCGYVIGVNGGKKWNILLIIIIGWIIKIVWLIIISF